MNIRKIIKEELLKEVGGYDDQNVMAQHAGATIGTLTGIYRDIMEVISGLANKIMDGNVDKHELGVALEALAKLINNGVRITSDLVEELTEDELISKAKDFIKDLNSFKRKIRLLSNLTSNYTQTEYIEKLKEFIIDAAPKLKKYGDTLMDTTRMFGSRLSGMRGGTSFN
tara:strand:+ start:22739 stop:23248 length:510 start_codon:yes stop_codon:yes gene_type:complete